MTHGDVREASRIRRLLLALEAPDCAQPLITTAAAIAAALQAQLEVLLLEDEALHAAAALPIMREISSTSARTRDLSATSLESALRAISQAAESGFRAATGDGEGRFTVRRGLRGEALEEAVAEVDLLLLPGRRGVLRFRVPPSPRVCAVCSDAPAGRRALELASRLSRQTGRTLSVVHAGAAALPGLPPNRRQDFAAGTALGGLLSAADTGPGNLLVVSRDIATAGGKRPSEQLATLHCDVLVVG